MQKDKEIKIKVENVYKTFDVFLDKANSIKENGLINPLIVRQKENGRYELISGHRRKLALELNGIKEANCYVECCLSASRSMHYTLDIINEYGLIDSFKIEIE